MLLISASSSALLSPKSERSPRVEFRNTICVRAKLRYSFLHCSSEVYLYRFYDWRFPIKGVRRQFQNPHTVLDRAEGSKIVQIPEVWQAKAELEQFSTEPRASPIAAKEVVNMTPPYPYSQLQTWRRFWTLPIPGIHLVGLRIIRLMAGLTEKVGDHEWIAKLESMVSRNKILHIQVE